MTKELLVRCTACYTTFIAEIPDQWTEQDLQYHTRDIFTWDQPLNCWLHPRRELETMELYEGWLNQRLSPPPLIREVPLPVRRVVKGKKR